MTTGFAAATGSAIAKASRMTSSKPIGTWPAEATLTIRAGAQPDKSGPHHAPGYPGSGPANGAVPCA